MGGVREYERKVIRILTKDVLPPDVIDAVISAGEIVSYEHTGVGYFLTLRHARLPSERIVCDEPMVLGRANGIETGFVVFLENRQLMLECHSWGDDSIPETYRDEEVEIAAD